jgi:hypothetical protein
MGSGPILTFDTSAVNWLADDPDSDALIAALRSGFHVRLAFTTIAEVAASKDTARRRQLLRVCNLLLLSGDCIDPVYEVLRKLVARFEEPGPFNWADVPMDIADARDLIARPENITEELAREEREESREFEKKFAKTYNDARPAFDRLVESDPEKAPRSISELVAGLQRPAGGFWNAAQSLYNRVAKHPADEALVRMFTEACDPFRAMMIAIFAALYDRCLKPPNVSPPLRTGRTDTFMAIYLPYCHEFVTNDRAQLECFKQVAAIAGIEVIVRSYEDLRSTLPLVGASARSVT